MVQRVKEKSSIYARFFMLGRSGRLRLLMEEKIGRMFAEECPNISVNWIEKYEGKRVLIVSHGDPIWLFETFSKGLAKKKLR